MQVNATNAKIVAAIFASLSDARFNMRTIGAIVVSTATPSETPGEAPVPTMTSAEIANVATDLGMQLRHRVRDGAPLIERPAAVSAEAALEIARKAGLIVAGGGEAFELDFTPAVPDAVGDVDGGDDTDTNDEDDQFNSTRH